MHLRFRWHLIAWPVVVSSARSGSGQAKAGLPKERLVLIGYFRVLKCAFRPPNGHFNGDSIRFKCMRNGSKKTAYEVYGNYVEGLEKEADKILEYFGGDFSSL